MSLVVPKHNLLFVPIVLKHNLLCLLGQVGNLHHYITLHARCSVLRHPQILVQFGPVAQQMGKVAIEHTAHFP
jgi:hypothetical protein